MTIAGPPLCATDQLRPQESAEERAPRWSLGTCLGIIFGVSAMLWLGVYGAYLFVAALIR